MYILLALQGVCSTEMAIFISFSFSLMAITSLQLLLRSFYSPLRLFLPLTVHFHRRFDFVARPAVVDLLLRGTCLSFQNELLPSCVLYLPQLFSSGGPLPQPSSGSLVLFAVSLLSAFVSLAMTFFPQSVCDLLTRCALSSFCPPDFLPALFFCSGSISTLLLRFFFFPLSFFAL